MADQVAQGGPLKSLNSDEPTYIDFVNQSNQNARAWWLNLSGHPVSYGDIKPGEVLEMNTFLTHPWIFRTSENGAKLLANLQEVYFPTPAQHGENGYLEFLRVKITTPVYTLQECCLMLIRKIVRREDINQLDIPELLRRDLRLTPDLLKEIGILNLTRSTN